MSSVAISQSNYIPWKGYFDLMTNVDTFVLYDDVQFTRRDWRNRNIIKTPQGKKWLTIPVKVKGKYHQKIKDVKISDREWNKKHWDILEQNYKNANSFKDVRDFLEDLYANANSRYLSEINYHFLKNIANYLGIKVNFRWSSEFDLAEGKNERLIGIGQQLGVTDYYSGPAARAYMDMDQFDKANIKVHFFDYSGYKEYEQIYPPFEHGVSIVDMLFNIDKNSKNYLK